MYTLRHTLLYIFTSDYVVGKQHCDLAVLSNFLYTDNLDVNLTTFARC